MDEKLNATIEKVVQLCRQNAEFDIALRKRLFQISSVSTVAKEEDKRIDKIEKYLGLDYAIDGQESLVDYSYVSKLDIRNQLVSDNREMMRYRYGTRSHMIDFNEFCRYAHLQMELLVNYYYNIVNNSDLNLIKAHIKQYNPKAKGIDDAMSLSAIAYNVKIWAFKEEYKVKERNLFDNIRRARNETSHRSVEEDQIVVSEYKSFLLGLGFKLKQDGSLKINWNDENADVRIKEIFNNQIKGTEGYKVYNYLLWYHSKPYDTIINCLIQFSNIISSRVS